MTDTIGWGDVEVESRPPRRRRHVSWIVWLLAVVVIAGIALAPVVKRDLAAASMRWLQRQWALQGALDDARVTELASATLQLGVADESTYVRLVQLVDGEERARLLRIEQRVAARHTWAADVGRARDQVRRTLRRQAADLGREIATVADAERRAIVVFEPTPYDGPTAEAITATDATVLRTAAAHHLGQVGRPKAHLSAGDALLRQLARVTDRPLPFRVVIEQPQGLVEWDLRTGSHRVVAAATDIPDGGVLPVVGDKVLAVSDARSELVPLDGSPPQLLPRGDSFAPDSRGGLWRLHGIVAQRLSPTLRPMGPGRRVPAGYAVQADFNIGVTADLFTITKWQPTDVGPTGGYVSTFLWSPETGRILPLPGGCGTAAAAGVAVTVDCTRAPSRLFAVDLDAGQRRALPLGSGRAPAGNAVLSPDGRRVAVPFAHAGDPEQTAQGVVVVDLATSTVTVVTDDANALPDAWSPDGNTLVLSHNQADNCCDFAQTNMLAYWQPGMSGIASLRIPIEAGMPAFALLS